MYNNKVYSVLMKVNCHIFRTISPESLRDSAFLSKNVNKHFGTLTGRILGNSVGFVQNLKFKLNLLSLGIIECIDERELMTIMVRI